MDKTGLKRIKAAARIADEALLEVVAFLKPGVKERSIAGRLLEGIRRRGGDGFSFRPIVASGARSAMPHGRASGKRVRRGEIVVVDFGVKFKGFCSDITRTFVMGKPSKRQRRLFNILKSAQQKAIEAVSAGVQCSAIDAVSRGFLRGRGLDRYFIHGTGHGIGRKVHEAPKISRKNENRLRAGTVITIEPGIYFKGWGGMRIEDMVLVLRSGCRVITKFPKELRIR